LFCSAAKPRAPLNTAPSWRRAWANAASSSEAGFCHLASAAAPFSAPATIGASAAASPAMARVRAA